MLTEEDRLRARQRELRQELAELGDLDSRRPELKRVRIALAAKLARVERNLFKLRHGTLPFDDPDAA